MLRRKVRQSVISNRNLAAISIVIGMIAGAAIVTLGSKGYASTGMLKSTSNQYMRVTSPVLQLLLGNNSNLLTLPSYITGLNSSSGDQRVIDESCAVPRPMRVGLLKTSDPQLNKLSQYEAVCNSAVITRESFFVSTPTTKDAAIQDATESAAKLKSYALFNITPLVIMEPVDDSGNSIDLNTYSTGTYDSILTTYFATLKSQGITDAMMGMWAYFPESNMPTWGTVDPDLFAANVTRTVRIQKQYFPVSQATILLDSESYAPGASWGDGSYVSLLPYVQNIPKGLLDSFGLQGFPWAAPSNGSDSLYDPKVYLQVALAAQAAQALGVRSVWLNTGTFSRAYTQNASQTVRVGAVQRQIMLNGVIAQARELQSQGLSVAVHLFAQNKSDETEAVDWSYWHAQPGNDPDVAVFKSFAHNVTAAGMQLWLYDTN